MPIVLLQPSARLHSVLGDITAYSVYHSLPLETSANTFKTPALRAAAVAGSSGSSQGSLKVSFSLTRDGGKASKYSFQSSMVFLREMMPGHGFQP